MFRFITLFICAKFCSNSVFAVIPLCFLCRILEFDDFKKKVKYKYIFFKLKKYFIYLKNKYQIDKIHFNCIVK